MITLTKLLTLFSVAGKAIEIVGLLEGIEKEFSMRFSIMMIGMRGLILGSCGDIWRKSVSRANFVQFVP